MMLRIKILLSATLTLWASTVAAQSNEPHIGYLYPAGGQRGATIIITAGGQFLRGAAGVCISGKGVHASVVEHIGPFLNTQREEVQTRITVTWDKRTAELNINNAPPLFPNRNSGKTVSKNPLIANENDPNGQKIEKTEHPLLYDLDNKSIRELLNIREILFSRRSQQQQNRQIAESVLIKITIDPNAEPGNRELRIMTALGLTNPVIFQVGALAETMELEPNGQKDNIKYPVLQKLPKESPLELPVLINGQIFPGDLDRFRFAARRGQNLVIVTQARSLIPYLADAVPGWFQAKIALYDMNDKQVALDDDYLFNPDPVMFYRIAVSGEYELEIHDALYRGREDFVYRIAIGELPFVTQIFPPGGEQEVKTFAHIDGWNLDRTRIILDTKPGPDRIRQTILQKGHLFSNPLLYAVDNLPECNDTENNGTIENSQQITLPIIINGRISRSGDIDVFHIKGKAGEKIAAEVSARQFNSPLDSILRLTDESGNVLQWNDDYAIEENHLYADTSGLLTHHADSYLQTQFVGDENYFVHITDSQNHGGKTFSYRLRISAPQGNFALRMTPSSLNAAAGASTAFCVYALRKDGFDGEIEVSLKDAPAGFEIAGGVIPAGRNNVRMTMSVPRTFTAQPVILHLQGTAKIGGKTITHPVIPCEDMMQAFLYRHLVPSQQLMFSVIKSRQPPPFERLGDSRIKIPAGGSISVKLKTWKRPVDEKMRFELRSPPDGLTLQGAAVTHEGMVELKFKADKNMKSGFMDNIIVEISTEFTPRQNAAKSGNQKRIISMGFLPAIPVEITPEVE